MHEDMCVLLGQPSTFSRLSIVVGLFPVNSKKEKKNSEEEKAPGESNRALKSSFFRGREGRDGERKKKKKNYLVLPPDYSKYFDTHEKDITAGFFTVERTPELCGFEREREKNFNTGRKSGSESSDIVAFYARRVSIILNDWIL